jgi:polar amino acid transport system substrate-binding protein
MHILKKVRSLPMKKISILALLALLVSCTVFAGCVQSPGADDARIDMLVLLTTMQGEINGALAAIDRSAEMTAGNLSRTGLAGPDVDALLSKAVDTDPSILTAAVIARNGTVTAVQPDVEGLVGSNLLDQPVVREVFARNVPLMSDLFPLRQGGYAATIEYPVFSSNGQVIGAVSLAFQPDVLIGAHAEPAVAWTPYAVMATQPDGLVLYDADSKEIGKNTFKEAMYADFPELLDIARQHEQNRSGHAAYSFYGTGSEKIVQKEIYWTTVGLYGNEWRLSIVREIDA